MHYDICYSHLDHDPIAKHNKAIQDIKDYLGEDRFNKLTQCVQNEPEQYTFDQFRLAVSFAGIQGYPVRAWYNYVYGL